MRSVIICFVFILPFCSKGQNLVINGSFEDLANCNLNDGAITTAFGWSNFYSGESSVDLYNSCCQNPFCTTPNNEMIGFQVPATGLGFAGLIPTMLLAPPNDTAYEAAMGTLNAPLLKDSVYHVSFKVSLANYAGKAVKNLGLKFVDSHAPVSFSSFHNLTPDLWETEYVTDTVGWYRVQGTYLADGNEVGVVVGLFPPFSLEDLTPINGSNGGAYYLIEDVCVSLDSTTCFEPLEILEIKPYENWLIYPNPVTTNLTIESSTPLAQVWLSDMAGRSVLPPLYPSRTSGYANIDVSSLPSGIYLVEAITEDGRRSVQKVVVE